jgi:hypothetical protein
MNWPTYTTRYPDTAGLLPSNFMNAADNEHHLLKAINRDRTNYLDKVESLISKTPARQIAQGSYQNDLTRKVAFSSFLSELKAYVIMDNVCSPTPADVASGDGLPDLTCENFGRGGIDIEVTRLSSWDKMDEVQMEVEDMFNGTPYTPIINWSENFFVMPYTHVDISANERFVENIREKLQNVNPNNPPGKVANYGIEIEFRKTGASHGVIGGTAARAFPIDPVGAIRSRLIEKTSKQRGYRPLIIFLDSQLSFLDLIDIEDILHGTASSFMNPDPSPIVEKYERVWQSYLSDKGYLRNDNSSRIEAGDEGIFAKNEFDQVAGVVLFDITNTCHYVPNFYSRNLELKHIFSEVDNKIDGQSFPNLF